MLESQMRVSVVCGSAIAKSNDPHMCDSCVVQHGKLSEALDNLLNLEKQCRLVCPHCVLHSLSDSDFRFASQTTWIL